MRQHAARIVHLAKEYDRQAEALEGQREILDQLTSAQSAFVDQVTGNFTNDLFGNGLQGVFTQAGADTADASAFTAVLTQLAGMGLDGPAFQALAASGDLATAQELAASGMIDAFEQAIAGRETALSQLGGTASDLAGFTSQIAAQNTLIATTQRTMDSLQQAVDRQEKTLRELAGLPGSVKDGTERGAYRGVKDAMLGRDSHLAAARR